MILYIHDLPSGLFLKFMYSITVSKYVVTGILIGLYTSAVRSCENIDQSDNSKVALIGSKEWLP